MQDEARRGLGQLGPPLRILQRGRIAVKGVHRRPCVEQRAGIAASAERTVDDQLALRGPQCGNHFVEQDGDVGGRGAHLFLPFSRASFSSARQAALGIAISGPIS